ncbi:PREDICTED: pre-rRNA-processing protein TSR2 homolog isoform X2 [Priapulus caudatus]|uniref:Pre-rRNA-processing protein TSR2 homolog n=1 Tax=Priapulus caudatus TaxID=37621 RepID=A0ABM1EBH3_PRICU|nr:PREDICTED: pre-rRNA-processing protein TSR2 homolog isoform X2 [Priapulus caudatus]
MAASLQQQQDQQRVFRESVCKLMDGWAALQLAVEQGFGGVHSQQKEIWFCEVIYQFFQDNAGLDPLEVEDFISELMNNEFETMVEDGSLQHIAKVLCQYFNLCAQGKTTEVVNELEKIPDRNKVREVVTMSAATANAENEQSDDSDESGASDDNRTTQIEGASTLTPHTAPSSAQSHTNDEEMEIDGSEMEHRQEEADGWSVVKTKKSNKKK